MVPQQGNGSHVLQSNDHTVINQYGWIHIRSLYLRTIDTLFSSDSCAGGDMTMRSEDFLRYFAACYVWMYTDKEKQRLLCIDCAKFTLLVT